MSFDLTNQNLQDTYKRLVQVSSSTLLDGTGSRINNIETTTISGSLSGSFQGEFTRGRIGNGVVIEEGSTKILSTGFLGQTSASQGTGPAGFVIYSGSNTTTLGGDTLSGTGFKFVSANDNSHIIFTDQNDGDLSIKTDKFVVQNNGDITASNALFSGTLIASNIIQNTTIITGPNQVGEYEPNFDQYMVATGRENSYTLKLDGQQGGVITNNVEFRLSNDPITINDIVPEKDNIIEGAKVNIGIRVRPDSNTESSGLKFNIEDGEGNTYQQVVGISSEVQFEIDYIAGENKRIRAINSSDFSIPITSSNGFKLKGNFIQDGNYILTGSIDGVNDITQEGNTIQTGKHSIGTNPVSSPQKSLHIRSNTNGDGIRIEGSNNPLFQIFTVDDLSYTQAFGIISVTSPNTGLAGSIAGDTTIRYSYDDNPNGRLLFGSGSDEDGVPSLVLDGSNVGINTLTPGNYALNVSGSGNFTNGLTITGSLIISSSNTFTNIGLMQQDGCTEFTGSIQQKLGIKNLIIGTNAASASIQNCVGTSTGESVILGHDTTAKANSSYYTVAIGSETLRDSHANSFNTAIGYRALYQLGGKDGTLSQTPARTRFNVALGGLAGAQRHLGSVTNTTGFYFSTGSIFIGYQAYASGSSPQLQNAQSENEIVIGYQALGQGSNSVTLGNDNITKTLLKGNVGIGTLYPTEKLSIEGNVSASGAYTGSTLQLTDIVNANVNTNKFLVLDTDNNVDFRTAVEVLNDIGATTAVGNAAADGTSPEVAFFSSSNGLTGSSAFTFDSSTNPQLKLAGTFDLNDGGSQGSVYIGTNVGNPGGASRDVAIGTDALTNHTVGLSVAVGYRALSGSQYTQETTAIGTQVMEYSSNTVNNVAIGSKAFRYLNQNVGSFRDDVGNNIAIGAYAGNFLSNDGTLSNTSNLIDASSSIYIGYNSLGSGSNIVGLNYTASNEIVIGTNAIGHGSDSVTLGNDDILKTILKGNVGIGTSYPGENLEVVGNVSASGAYTGSTLQLHGIIDAGVNTDKFLVLDTDNNVDFRSGSQMRSDLDILDEHIGINSIPASLPISTFLIGSEWRDTFITIPQQYDNFYIIGIDASYGDTNGVVAGQFKVEVRDNTNSVIAGSSPTYTHPLNSRDHTQSYSHGLYQISAGNTINIICTDTNGIPNGTDTNAAGYSVTIRLQK